MATTNSPALPEATLPAPCAGSPDCLTGNLGWLLSQANYAYGCEVAAALEPLGLGSRGVCVLGTAIGGEYSQTQLAQMIGLDKTMMMVTLDELERQGLAERQRSPRDRRAHVVAVTPAGVAKLAEAQSIIASVQESVLASLPEGERLALTGALVRLVTERLSEPPECPAVPRRRDPRA